MRVKLDPRVLSTIIFARIVYSAIDPVVIFELPRRGIKSNDTRDIELAR